MIRKMTPKSLSLSGRVYRLLLYAYPASFRREYGRPMAQLFRDEARRTIHEGGGISLISFWLLTLVDLVKSALTEHVWEIFHMPLEKLERWSGLAAFLGGLLWLSFFYLVDTDFGLFDGLGEMVSGLVAIGIFVLLFVFLAMGLAGLYSRLPGSPRWAKVSAFAVAMVGLLLHAVGAITLFLGIGSVDLSVGAAFVGFYVLDLGIAILGIVALLKRALGPLSFVPFFIAAAGLGVGLTVFGITLGIVYGIAWILLGLALWGTPEEVTGPALPA